MKLGHYINEFEKTVTDFRDAKPFPWTFAPTGDFDLSKVAAEFESSTVVEWKQFQHKRERKLSCNDRRMFGKETCRAVDWFNGDQFLTYLREISGIEDIMPDPSLRGAGMHMIERGGKLDVHVDFNHHKELNATRRLNLILFLNDHWKDEWGGHLDLWSDDGTEYVRISPTLGTCVLFEASETSWHGHPLPLDCPEGVRRKSLALYYYSPGMPERKHGTVFRDVNYGEARCLNVD